MQKVTAAKRLFAEVDTRSNRAIAGKDVHITIQYIAT